MVNVLSKDLDIMVSASLRYCYGRKSGIELTILPIILGHLDNIRKDFLQQMVEETEHEMQFMEDEYKIDTYRRFVRDVKKYLQGEASAKK